MIIYVEKLFDILLNKLVYRPLEKITIILSLLLKLAVCIIIIMIILMFFIFICSLAEKRPLEIGKQTIKSGCIVQKTKGKKCLNRSKRNKKIDKCDKKKINVNY